MDNAQNIATGVALPGYPNIGGGTSQGQQRPARTFDGISKAVQRVRASKVQVDRMLDRVSQGPPEAAANAINNAVLGEPRYAVAIEQLDAALTELGRSLDELEKHI